MRRREADFATPAVTQAQSILARWFVRDAWHARGRSKAWPSARASAWPRSSAWRAAQSRDLVQVRAEGIGAEVLFPESRREFGHACGRVLADALQDIDQVGVGIDAV